MTSFSELGNLLASGDFAPPTMRHLASPTVPCLEVLYLTSPGLTTFIPYLILVAGGEVPGDGQGGFFYWSPISTLDDDGFYVILPNGRNGAGRWIRTSINLGIDMGLSPTDNAVVAQGSTQSAATILAALSNNVIGSQATSAPWSGVILPQVWVPGMKITVWNNSANNIWVYPPPNCLIGNEAANLPDIIFPSGATEYVYMGSGLWLAKG